RPTARSSASTAPSPLSGPTRSPTQARPSGPPPTNPGCITTITTDPTPASAATSPQPAFTTCRGSTPRWRIRSRGPDGDRVRAPRRGRHDRGVRRRAGRRVRCRAGAARRPVGTARAPRRRGVCELPGRCIGARGGGRVPRSGSRAPGGDQGAVRPRRALRAHARAGSVVSRGGPMPTADARAAEFDVHRRYLTTVAYRMLGSYADAEDAVQEAWFRLAGTDAPIEDLRAWLVRVVSRVSLDRLR